MRYQDTLDAIPSTEDTTQLVLSTILPIVYFQAYSKDCFQIFMRQPSYAQPLRDLNRSIKNFLQVTPAQASPLSMQSISPLLKSMHEPSPQNAHQLFIGILNAILISHEHICQLEQFLEESIAFRHMLQEIKVALIAFIKQHVTQLLSFRFEQKRILPRFFMYDLRNDIPEYCIPELHLYFSPFYPYTLFLKRADIKLQTLNDAILEISISHNDLTSRYPEIEHETSMSTFKQDLVTLNRKSEAAVSLLKYMLKNIDKFQDSASKQLYNLLTIIEEKNDALLTILNDQIDAHYEDSDDESIEASDESETEPLILRIKTSLLYDRPANEQATPMDDIDVVTPDTAKRHHQW